MTVVPLDATDRDAVRRAAAEVTDALGGLDVVVWCAGYWKQFDAAQWDPDVFARHVEVNLLGLNNVLAAVLPAMAQAEARTHRRDRLGRRVPRTRRGRGVRRHQGGADQPARGVAGRAGPAHVRVTTVCPGFVRTEMTDDQRLPDAVHDRGRRGGPGDRRRAGGAPTEIVFPLPMAALMKVARLVPVRLWAALSSRAHRSSET